jgi:NAD-reducing hydrogenase small subunit
MDPVKRPRVATVWLGGCSGCHMSFLDLDERLLDLAGRMDLVFSPVADVKVFPEGVDVALVEGAVCNEEHLHAARAVRARSRLVVAFGDCAVTGNVTAIRNALGTALPVLDRAYRDAADLQPQLPCEPGIVPPLLDRVLPLHQVVPVDAWLPGCPPHADLIHAVLTDLLAGRPPALAGHLRYG